MRCIVVEGSRGCAQTPRSHVATLARGSEFRPNAVLVLAISHLLAGEVDQADDLLADATEEGLELGVVAAVTVALGERALIASERGAWVQAEELTDQALRVIGRARMEEYPTSALAYVAAARVALHRGNSAACHELLTRAQRLRPRLTYALPYFAVQTRLELARAYLTLADAGGAATMLREIDVIAAPPAGPRSAPGRGGRAAREPDDAAHAAPGASTLTEAELRLLPYSPRTCRSARSASACTSLATR